VTRSDCAEIASSGIQAPTYLASRSFEVAGGVLIQFLGAKLISSRCFKLKKDMRIKQGRYRDKSARGSVLGAIELLYG
jgi:hypothetical protein